MKASEKRVPLVTTVDQATKAQAKKLARRAEYKSVGEVVDAAIRLLTKKHES